MKVSKATWPRVHSCGVCVTTCFVKPMDGWQEVCVAGGGMYHFISLNLEHSLKAEVFFFFLQSMSDCTNRLAAFVFRIGKTKAWEPG